MEFVLKEYTQEERKSDMLKELKDKGLYKAVENRCDSINEECINQNLGYIPHRIIQEMMCEILELIQCAENLKTGD